MTSTTPFWELTSVALAIIQAVFYIDGFSEYERLLNRYSDDLGDKANERMAAYRSVRDRDEAFYAAYDAMPSYAICDSVVRRSKGAAFSTYAEAYRQGRRTAPSYTPFTRQPFAFQSGRGAVFSSAITRANLLAGERARVDRHTLAKWDAIVQSPTFSESNSGRSLGIITSSLFSQLGVYGQGANSALTAIGYGAAGLKNG